MELKKNSNKRNGGHTLKKKKDEDEIAKNK